MHMLAVLRELERKYPQEIVIIGVHSAKFLAEKAASNLRPAVRRLRVDHPVVNDKDFQVWRSYRVQAWPTLVFIDPIGRVIDTSQGEVPLPALDRTMAGLIREYDQQGLLHREPLSWQREREEAKTGLLYFPGKVAVSGSSGRLFIADTGHHRLLIAGMDGSIQGIVGDGHPGLRDGGLQDCRFDAPEGMALYGERLFVADTENHAIRRVDLEKATVETIAGTGEQAMAPVKGGPARQTALSSPWDLAIHQGTLYIAMAGTHQIWSLDLISEKVSVFAGTGNEGIRDGSREAAWFAQPSGLGLDGDQLYVADSETSAIRRITLGPGDGVGTILGLGLFEFGDVDGIGGMVRLQHPLGLTVAEGVLYVADSYNHKIKRISPSVKEAKTYAGSGGPGLRDGVGPAAAFHEPGGLSYAAGRLYVADTNNHAIRVIDMATKEVRTLDLT